MDKNVETWIKLLYTYGPFALLALFVFIVERRAWKALRESLPDTKTLCKVIYSSVWAVILGLVIFTTYVWYRINVHEDYVIAGTIENLDYNAKIRHREPKRDLYLCRIYHGKDHGKEHVSEQWRLVTANKLEDGEIFIFDFDPGPNSKSNDNVRQYGMIIRQEFYKEKVRIRYDEIKSKLMLTCGKIKEEILPVDQDHRDKLAQRQDSLIGVAHADEPLAAAELTKRLESDDSIIRRDARLELGKLGEKALPWILKVLETPTSSYRLKVGVINALGNMAQVKPEQLSQAALNAVIEASVDNDLTLRGSALRFFGKHPSREHLAQLQQAVAKTRASGADPERLSRLARAQLEILYNIGVREKDLYGSKREEDKGHIQTALSAFKEAWELRTLAVPEDQIYFTKALYGWGLALHDRSWIERLPNDQRNPDLVKAAQDKFQEFLQAYDRAPNKEKYPYAKHDDCARAYIENPVPKSLKQ